MSSDTEVTIRLHDADNVVTAKETIPSGTNIPGEELATAMEIPMGHKVATKVISSGEAIRKYDQIIGFATEQINPGSHVHTQNVEMKEFDRDYKFGEDAKPTDFIPDAKRAKFQGIVRPDGRVAIGTTLEY